MSNIKIYTLSCPYTGDVKYIGKTNREDLNLRLNEHIYKAKKNLSRTKCSCWIKSLLNNNSKPIIDIIDEVGEDWSFWEKYWIEQFKSWGFNLKNLSIGGESGSAGCKWSEESRKKASKDRKNNPNYKSKKGPMSEEHKKKRKDSILNTMRNKLNITDALIKSIFSKIDCENKSMRKTAKELNIPYNRVRGIYLLKQY